MSANILILSFVATYLTIGQILYRHACQRFLLPKSRRARALITLAWPIYLKDVLL